jgi:hypothetical protein
MTHALETLLNWLDAIPPWAWVAGLTTAAYALSCATRRGRDS